MKQENSLLKQLWETELEILQVVHNICVENNLKYTLAYGSLLGAVRHKGFIPWDDDIDIMMPRSDYQKLLKIWSDVAPKDFIIQDYNTDSDYTNNFAKVRKNNTTFLQYEYEKTKKYHKGIFIDIFPGSCLAPKGISRTMQYVCFAINLLYSRGYTSGTAGVIGKIERMLLKTNKQNYIKRRNLAEKMMGRWDKKEKGKYVFPCTIACCKHYYPADMFENLIFIEFENRKFFMTLEYDKILQIEYGNYMQLPPESERVWKHHPLIIDFESNYESL